MVMMSYREGRGRNSSTQRNPIHPLRLFPRPKTVAPLRWISVNHTKEAKEIKGITRVPYIPRIARELDECDSKEVLVYIEDSRDDDRHREVFLDEGIVEIQVALHEEAVIIPVGVTMR